MKHEDILLLSTAEWRNPFWTNKQHVAIELARMGHRVVHVDSLGLRRPTASGADLGRIAARLRRAARGPEKVRDRLWVWSPFVVPLQRFGAVRRFNRALLDVTLRRTMAQLGFAPDVLWTYNPMTTQLVDTRRFGRLVYHCVDEIGAQPGMPSQQIWKAEEHLARTADIIFATSPALATSRRRWNDNTHYFSNVADFDHFAQTLDPTTPIPADLQAIPAPRLGFVGAITDYKLDTGLIAAIARARPEWSIVLIGKIGEGDPSTDVGSLHDVPNVHLLGPRDYRSLPSYLKGIDVALLPNRISTYTEAMFPMKFFEYLAAGRPVVATPLPAIDEHRDVVEVAADAAGFVQAVERALAGKTAPLETRLERARRHTYAARMERMMATYRETVDGRAA